MPFVPDQKTNFLSTKKIEGDAHTLWAHCSAYLYYRDTRLLRPQKGNGTIKSSRVLLVSGYRIPHTFALTRLARHGFKGPALYAAEVVYLRIAEFD